MPNFSIKYKQSLRSKDLQVSSIKERIRKKTLDIGYWILDIPHQSEAGFTLIEILITVVIIGIVFGVVISSANAASMRARDTQRQGDIRNIQSALQQYYSDMNYYPNNTLILSTTPGLTSSTANGGTSPNPVKTYVSSNNFPRDPRNSITPYCYFAYASSAKSACDNSDPATTCQYYEISAQLESKDSGGSAVNCHGTTVKYNLTISPN